MAAVQDNDLGKMLYVEAEELPSRLNSSIFSCRIPLDPELQVDMLGSVFVDTVDSVSTQSFSLESC